MTVEFKPNRGGILLLMASPEMGACMLEHAEEIASRARALDGQVYGSRAKMGGISMHGYAFTGNFKAMVSNKENDTLSKALGGA